MNKLKAKRVVSIIMVLLLFVLTAAGCSREKKTKIVQSNNEATPAEVSEQTPKTGEVRTIRWGSHNIAALDPYNTDPTTGEYTMNESERQAAIAALDKVKDELNVEVEFVLYSTDVRSELITSVLAGNPVCDIAMIWGGAESTILAQNILQELDGYEDMFTGDEYSWMFYDKLYGHNYFVTGKQAFVPRWPLIYNISMLEKVDSLKDANGRTIYPTDLFKEGKWTFSTFKDYLSKVQTYYANVPGPDTGAHSTVQAYETDWRFAGLSAIYAAGGSIYGANGLEVDSKETLKGTAFITELKNTNLLTDPGVYDDGFIPVWTKGGDDIRTGGTVFTDCPDWRISSAATGAAERGEAIGIVPWPRPDDMAFDDENYRQVLTVGDSLGILKGVDEDTTKLCLEFLKLYYKTYYEIYGGVSSIINYKENMAATQATTYGFDIFNETYGDDLLDTFIYVSNQTVPNDYADLLGIRGNWDVIFGKSLYGLDGFPAYDIAIEANKDEFKQKISEMEDILSSGEIRDNIAPNMKSLQTFAFAKGTDASSVNWAEYISAEDAVNGILDVSAAAIDVSATDFNAVGAYDDGFIAKISDKAGNEATFKTKVIIFDPNNTEPPVITAKEEYRTIKVDEDASAISWKDDFIETAIDKDGFDIKNNLKADLSILDTTTPGDYDVVITATDFAGNTSDITLKVTVMETE